MLLRTITSGLFVVVLAAASGCYTMPYHAGYAGPPGLGGYYAEDACGPCGPVGYRHFPLLDRLNYLLTAGSGCGDVYWGEWTNHPPRGCDPCDDHGNWVGHGYGVRAPRGPGHVNWVDEYHDPALHPFQGLRHLWGYRYGDAGYPVVHDAEYELGVAGDYAIHDSGCTSCSSGMVSMIEGPIEMPAGEVIRSAPSGGSSRPPSGPGSAPSRPTVPGSRDASTPRRLTATPASPVDPSRR